ncbi:hypothetical protein [Vibrio cholerae]|uniref:hypothetical protein n=1 Tax=Vibrio cholerae TaxID=666 RepID=UPI0011587710|nr:hypothetical protein [Vibrio cholerae]TQQ78343.1 hypothetical protein FLL59_00015 [Vibrio cholerae]
MKKTLLACSLLMLFSGMSYTCAEEIEEINLRSRVTCRAIAYHDVYVDSIYSGSIEYGDDYPASVLFRKPDGTKYGHVSIFRPKEPGFEYRNLLSILMLAKTLRTQVQVSCTDDMIDTVYY